MAKLMLDTNVLVYAASAEPADRLRHLAAVDLVRTGQFVLCAEALQECYDVVTRGKAPAMTPVEALTWVEQWEVFCTVDLSAETVKAGAEIAARYKLRYWDGAMLAAAHQAGAETFVSEDLNHGQTYGSVRVENPFLNA